MSPVNLDELRGKLYMLAEAADVVGIRVEALRRLARSGVIQATVPTGARGYRITGEALIAWLTGGGKPTVGRPKKKAAARKAAPRSGGTKEGSRKEQGKP